MFDFSPFQGLVNNASILLAMGILYDVIVLGNAKAPKFLEPFLRGIVIGLMGIALMMSPWVFSTGLVFDTRSILLVISGFFFSPITSIIAMVFMALFRIMQGGTGALTGIIVIVLSLSTGLIFRIVNKSRFYNVTIQELFFMGLVSHVLMILAMFTLPNNTGLAVIKIIALPVLLIYTPLTTLLGLLIKERFLAKKQREELVMSEERYRMYVSHAPIGVFVVSADLNILYANPAGCTLSGYDLEKILEMNVTNLVSKDEYARAENHFNTLQKDGSDTGTISIVNAHKQERKWLVNAVKLSQNRYMGFVIDITEKEATEKQVKDALKEKEILLKELYHRTKNNMQVIRSMMVLQAGNKASAETQKLIQEMDGRIQTMSLVHQMLYQSGNLVSINLKEYLENLSNSILSSSANSKELILERIFEIDAVMVPIELAISIGLIVNECLTNTLKYAFPNSKTGTIKISLKEMDNFCLLLTISDTGKGFDIDFNPETSTSMGLKTIYGIVRHQLQGTIQLHNINGVSYEICINNFEHKEF